MNISTENCRSLHLNLHVFSADQKWYFMYHFQSFFMYWFDCRTLHAIFILSRIDSEQTNSNNSVCNAWYFMVFLLMSLSSDYSRRTLTCLHFGKEIFFLCFAETWSVWLVNICFSWGDLLLRHSYGAIQCDKLFIMCIMNMKLDTNGTHCKNRKCILINMLVFFFIFQIT